MSRRTVGPIMMTTVVLGLVFAGGCGDKSGASQTRVITPAATSEATSTITPLERGKIRRDVLAVAEAGVAAWLSGDTATLPKYFVDEWVKRDQDQKTKYTSEDKTRVRAHSHTSMDVTQLNAAGDQAIVEYLFIDDSYFAATDGTHLDEPTHKETEFQLTLALEDGSWRIIRMIGGAQNLQ